MKHISYLLAALGLTSAAIAAPFAALGDGSELFLTGTAGIRYDDNVFLLSSGAKGDFIYNFAPGLEIDFGKSSLVKGTLTAREDFVRYTDHSSQNNEFTQVAGKATYSDDKLSLTGAASYSETAQNNADLRGNGFLVEHEVYGASLTGEMVMSEKTSFGSGIDFSRTHYKKNASQSTGAYFDQNTYTVPFTAYYRATPKLDVSAGYTYKETNLTNTAGHDAWDNFFSAGLRGEFTPKLNGTVAVGYSERRPETGKSTDLLGIASSLNFQISPTLSLTGGLSNQFTTAATGENQKTLNVNLDVNATISEQLSVNAGVQHDEVTYLGTTRKDKGYSAHAGVGYAFNPYLSLAASYAYTGNESKGGGVGYSGNAFSLSVTARY